MMETVISSIIAGFCTISVAVIGAISLKDRKKAEADRAEAKEARMRAEKRAELRAEESRLSMKMQRANCELGIVTALAVTGGHTNGNVKEALTEAKTAKKDYQAFLDRTVSIEKSKV